MQKSKNSYRLINPYIEGSMDTVVKSSNSFNAGKKLYNNLSNYFSNRVDDFYMTIQNLESKNLTHFTIGEKSKKGGMVDFNLVKLDNNFEKDIENKLINQVDKLNKQSGGKHKDDSSTTDSSSSDDEYYYKNSSQPINRFIYYYLPYYQLKTVGLSPIDASRLYLPMFGLPINPSLEIRFDIYKYFI